MRGGGGITGVYILFLLTCLCCVPLIVIYTSYIELCLSLGSVQCGTSTIERLYRESSPMWYSRYLVLCTFCFLMFLSRLVSLYIFNISLLINERYRRNSFPDSRYSTVYCYPGRNLMIFDWIFHSKCLIFAYIGLGSTIHFNIGLYHYCSSLLPVTPLPRNVQSNVHGGNTRATCR